MWFSPISDMTQPNDKPTPADQRGPVVEIVPAADALAAFRSAGGELVESSLEAEASARVIATWLQQYDPKTSRPTMRRKARALARMLFGVEDEDAAPWARLALPGGIEAVRSLRAALLEEGTRHDATGGSEGRTRRTGNSLLVALRAVAKTLWQLGALDAEKLERVRDASKALPNATRRAGKRLDTLDVREVIRAADGSTNAGLLNRAALALLTAGLRRTEVVEARWERLEALGTDGSMALRVIGKGGKERLVHLADAQVEALEVWADACGGPAGGPILRPVNKGGSIAKLPADAERGMSPTALANRIKRLSAKVGLDLGGLHNLRRWTVTTALEAGVPIPVAQRLVGHSDPRTTTSYIREDETKDGAALRSTFPGVFRRVGAA